MGSFLLRKSLLSRQVAKLQTMQHRLNDGGSQSNMAFFPNMREHTHIYILYIFLLQSMCHVGDENVEKSEDKEARNESLLLQKATLT